MGFINSIHDTKTGCDSVIAGAMDVIICYDSASTVNKVAIGPLGFSLDENKIYKIKFINGNTADNPTLNINGTGAINITTSNYKFKINTISSKIYEITFSSNNYIITDVIDDKDWFASSLTMNTYCQLAIGNCGYALSSSWYHHTNDVKSIIIFPIQYVYVDGTLGQIANGLYYALNTCYYCNSRHHNFSNYINILSIGSTTGNDIMRPVNYIDMNCYQCKCFAFGTVNATTGNFNVVLSGNCTSPDTGNIYTFKFSTLVYEAI